MFMMEAYARLFARDRRPIFWFGVLMSALALFGLTRLEFDDQPRGIFASEDARYGQLLELQETFGSDDNDVVLVCEAADWFGERSLAQLKVLVEGTQGTAGIQSVTWMGSVPIFEPGRLPRLLTSAAGDREVAREHPLVRGRLLSEDGRVTLVIARLEESIQNIEGIELVVQALRNLARECSLEPGVRISVTGIPPIRVDVFTRIHRDQMLFTVLGGVLCALLSLLLFRSIGAVIATTLPALIGAMWAMGFIGLVGYELNLMSAVLQMVVIVIGLTDSIHLVMDMRISRARGMAPVPAAAEAIRRLGMPCFLTSITTSVGFGSLALADVPIIQGFGRVAAGGILLSFLAILCSMPLIASWMPSVGTSPQIGSRPLSGGLGERLAARVLRLSLTAPRRTVASALVCMLFLFLAALRLQPENRLTEALPQGESLEALRLCERAFGGILPNYVVLEWEEGLELRSPEVLAALGEVEQLLLELPDVARPFSYLSLLDALPGGRQDMAASALIPKSAQARFVSEEKRQALVIAAVADGPSEVLLPLFERLQAGLLELQGRHPRLQLHLTGTDYVARTNVNGMIRDLATSLAFAALLIFAVIALEFRSLRLGLISLLPNLFPLALVGGALQLLGYPLQMSSAVLFTVLLGLAVDDTIHFLSRYRRDCAELGDVRAALKHAFYSVGRAIMITTAVLMLGFGTLAFSSIPLNQLFAGMACLGLAGALLGDLFFLPAMLFLFDRKRCPDSD